MNQKTSTHALFALVAILFAFTLPAAATTPPAVPDGMEMYIMALRGSPAGTHVAEPDVAALGGRVVTARLDRRLIVIPPDGAEQLRAHARVAWLQRVATGEPAARPREVRPRNITGHAKPSTVQTESDDPSWDTGEYQYDGSGNIKTIGADDYRYDSAGRLITAEVSGNAESYEYDAFGNMKKAGSTVTIDPDNNRVDSRAYDDAGNVVEDAAGNAYHYDAEGMITGLTVTAGNLTQRMIYTPSGERIAVQTMNGNAADDLLRITVRDFNNKVLREWEKGGVATEWVRDYVYAEGRLVAGERQLPTGATVRHFHLDHLGSIRRVSSEEGIEVGNVDYLPFGTEMPVLDTPAAIAEHNPPDPAKFTGHERDYQSGLDYMHARYYSAEWGRFLSVDPGGFDPARPQSWNRYTYASNNPINRVDPDGREDTWAQKAAKEFEAAGQAIKATGASLNQGGAMGMIADLTLGTLGDLVRGSGDMLNVGTATGEAIGSGADAHDMGIAISQDVGRGAALVLTMAAPSAAAHRSMTTTRVFRGVDGAEAANIQSTGAFRASPNGTEFKGFFFKRKDATSFAQRMTQQTGEAHTVVSGRVPNSVVRNSPAHNAATEGPGVLIRNSDLDKVVPR